MLAELSSTGGFLERDVKQTFADGKEQIWETVAAELIDEGTSTGKILLIRDVTDIRQMEMKSPRAGTLVLSVLWQRELPRNP